MINMNLLEVETPLYTYRGFSIRKTFWEEMFTGVEKVHNSWVLSCKHENFGCQNVREHREIKGSDEHFTFYIVLKFGSWQDKNHIFRAKGYFGKIRKGVDYLYESQVQIKAKEIQKGKVCLCKWQYDVPFKEYQVVWEVTL